MDRILYSRFQETYCIGASDHFDHNKQNGTLVYGGNERYTALAVGSTLC